MECDGKRGESTEDEHEDGHAVADASPVGTHDAESSFDEEGSNNENEIGPQ